MNKVILKMNGQPTELLRLVKCIKDSTGMGLRESKDLIDNMRNEYDKTKSTVSRLINVNKNVLENGLLSLTDKSIFTIIDAERKREGKMLDLGIGTSDDYREYISDTLSFKFTNENIDYIKESITHLLVDLNKDELEKIYKKIETV